MKENILSANCGSLILQQFTIGNPSISAALDLYDADNDMGKLVDTLQCVVKN